jgi:hypothetical protein
MRRSLLLRWIQNRSNDNGSAAAALTRAELEFDDDLQPSSLKIGSAAAQGKCKLGRVAGLSNIEH